MGGHEPDGVGEMGGQLVLKGRLVDIVGTVKESAQECVVV